MNKRTIKPAAGDSRMSAAAAKSAARYVYRDSRTGKFIISKDDIVVIDNVHAFHGKAGARKSRRLTGDSMKRSVTTSSKKR